MRTRRACYPSPDEAIAFAAGSCRQKRRLMSTGASSKGNDAFENPFDVLHDDLLISIMAALSTSANSPADLANAKMTCKRFCSAASNRKVLSQASMAALTVKASKWNEDSDKFLKLCADAGNREACYMLGMIRFYCLMNRGSGLGLMAEAAIASHPCALYSLAVIKFNGSGGFRKDKVLKAGVVLCAKAAAIGHLDAMRELGHCLQDGYGVKKNTEEGRKLLLEANAREAAAAREAYCCMHGFDYALSDGRNPGELNPSKNGSSTSSRHDRRRGNRRIASQSDFGCSAASPSNFHAINTFLVEWFALHPPAQGLRLCSHSQCGRPETRKHEFRRCSACGSVHYCSRACQALDWKMKHRYDCNPAENWDEQ